jgi:hypothetical protein
MSKLEDKLAASIKTTPATAPVAKAEKKPRPRKPAQRPETPAEATQASAAQTIAVPAAAAPAIAAPTSTPSLHPRRVWPD